MVPKSERDMYVIKINLPNDRHEFRPIQVANEIYGITLKICVQSPKRYTRLVLDKLMDLATDLANALEEANSIIPKIRSDYLKRRTLTLEAGGYLKALTKRVNVFVENPTLMMNSSNGDFRRLYGCLAEEEKLLNKMLEVDYNRYKDLPEI